MAMKYSDDGKYVPLALFFIALVIGTIFVWGIIRGVSFFMQGKFDGKHQYILALHSPSNQLTLVSFSPDTQSYSLLTQQGQIQSATKNLHIPFDGYIEERNTEGVVNALQNATFHHEVTNIAFVDRLRLWLFARSVAASQITKKSLASSVDQVTLDTSLQKLFTDTTLYTEGKTIAITNATGVSGLGNAYAKLLTNIGANVISVDTAQTPQKTSTILYIGDVSYTVKRMQKILGITPTQSKDKSAVSEIRIIIGTDKNF